MNQKNCPVTAGRCCE